MRAFPKIPTISRSRFSPRLLSLKKVSVSTMRSTPFQHTIRESHSIIAVLIEIKCEFCVAIGLQILVFIPRIDLAKIMTGQAEFVAARNNGQCKPPPPQKKRNLGRAHAVLYGKKIGLANEHYSNIKTSNLRLTT